MITIENGKLTIELDNNGNLQKDIAEIECWKSAILELFSYLTNESVAGGTIFWLGDLLQALQYDYGFLSEQLSKPE